MKNSPAEHERNRGCSVDAAAPRNDGLDRFPVFAHPGANPCPGWPVGGAWACACEEHPADVSYGQRRCVDELLELDDLHLNRRLQLVEGQSATTFCVIRVNRGFQGRVLGQGHDLKQLLAMPPLLHAGKSTLTRFHAVDHHPRQTLIGLPREQDEDDADDAGDHGEREGEHPEDQTPTVEDVGRAGHQESFRGSEKRRSSVGPSPTITDSVTCPARSCHAVTACEPGGTFGIVKRPSRPGAVK